MGRRLAERGDLELTVLCTDRTGTLPRREESDGLTILRCQAWPATRDYYVAPGIFDRVRCGDYDVVHCQGIHSPVPALAMLAARRARLPYMVTFHTGGHSSRLRHSMRGLQWSALAPLLRGAVALVAVSRFEVEMFRKATGLTEDRFHLIRNGGALPLPDQEVTCVPGRIVSSARLERYKGLQHVIRALPHVRGAVPDASLNILGTGPYQADLERLAAQLGVAEHVNIELIPPDDRTRMSHRLREAQVFAAFSEYEAHPVAVMEALTVGLRVVGYNTAGIKDLAEDGLVDPIDPASSPQEAAAALVKAMGTGAHAGPPQLPTWDDAADALADLYRWVADTGSDHVQ